MKQLKSPKFYILTVLLAVIGFVIWRYPVSEATLSIIEWIRHHGVWGYGIYIFVYTAFTVLLFPGSILTLGAGFVWGVLLGTALVSVSSMAGATAAFLVGRYLARDWVSNKIASNEKFERIDNAVAKRGFKIVFLTRLSPVFPFNLQNYAYSLTGVSLKDYFFASWIGMLPGTVMYVYIGSLFTELAQLGTGETPEVAANKILYLTGLIVTVIVTVYITKIARKALQEQEVG